MCRPRDRKGKSPISDVYFLANLLFSAQEKEGEGERMRGLSISATSRELKEKTPAPHRGLLPSLVPGKGGKGEEGFLAEPCGEELKI